MFSYLKSHRHRIFGLAFIAVLLLGLIACGGEAAPSAPQPTTQNGTAETPTGGGNTPATGGEATTAPTSSGEATAAPTSGGEATAAPTGGATGNLVADSGFRPETDGIPFENYVNDPGITNLTPDDMQTIFGDVACASKADGKCTLTPPAQQWMDLNNQSMGGGHCFGMSVEALNLWAQKMNLSDYGASSVTDLKLQGNVKLQRDIAHSWVFQRFDAVRAGVIAGTPNDVLDKLTQNLKAGKSAPDTYTIGFFKLDGTGGHAVTPYAVEDRGNGTFAVLIWDNNFPKTKREMIFDRNANTWSYTAATNPNEPAGMYNGTADSKSLFLFPTNPGLAKQACPFCAGTGTSRVGGAAALAQEHYEIYVEGSTPSQPHLLITDDQGRRYGYTSDGKFVTEIPNVTSEGEFIDSPSTWTEGEEPLYNVPAGLKFTLTIDGSRLKAPSVSNVVIVGAGHDIGLDDLKLNPGEKDTVDFSGDGTKLTFKTDTTETPDIVVGIEHKGADYAFDAKGIDLEGGGVLNVALDYDKGVLSLNTTGTTKPGTYGLVVDRIDDQGEVEFSHDNIELDPGDTAYLELGKWTGNHASMPLGIDRGSTGTVSETLDLTDSQ